MQVSHHNGTKPSGRCLVYLEDILQSIDNIAFHLAGIAEVNAFLGNLTVRRAVERELEIIGEAVNRLNAEWTLSIWTAMAPSLPTSSRKRNSPVLPDDLRSDIRFTFGEIEREQEEAEPLFRLSVTGSLDHIHTMAAAAILHSVNNGIESIFVLIGVVALCLGEWYCIDKVHGLLLDYSLGN